MDSTLFESLGRERAPELVTNRLREAITSGVLPPGTRLNQVELAERLGVSRMPVREALRRLEAEGLVILQPYRGAVVAGLSERELQEIYEMRIALEGLALRVALPQTGAATVEQMEDVLRRMDQEPDSDAWLALNAEFHDLLYAGADRPLLLEHIDSLRNKSDRFLRLFAAKRDRTAHAQEEHWAILGAYRDRDVDRACRLLQEHLQSTITSLSETLGPGDLDGAEDPSVPVPAPAKQKE